MISSVLFFNLLLYVTPYVSLAAPCEDISGRWISKLGALLEIDHLQNGVIRGRYYKPVGSSRGESRAHDIVGRFSQIL